MAREQSNGSLPREQLLRFFDRMSKVLERPDVKERIAMATRRGDACAVSAEIQGEEFAQMGVAAKVGLQSLAKVRANYRDDRECLLKYLNFVEKEGLAREEAELGPKAFRQRRLEAKELEDQQLKLLHQLRKLPPDVQEGFLHGLSKRALGISASTFFNSVTTQE